MIESYFSSGNVVLKLYVNFVQEEEGGSSSSKFTSLLKNSYQDPLESLSMVRHSSVHPLITGVGTIRRIWLPGHDTLARHLSKPLILTSTHQCLTPITLTRVCHQVAGVGQIKVILGLRLNLQERMIYF